jgi:hypothetical protein
VERTAKRQGCDGSDDGNSGAPEIWAGVSAWAPISDLNAWDEESRRLGTKYARQIAASCGGREMPGTFGAYLP